MEGIYSNTCDSAITPERSVFFGRVLISFLIVLLVSSFVFVPFSATAEKKKAKSKEQKLLERSANQSLYRLKRAIKKDGYYSARVSLNVWRENAIEAGILDEDQYHAFKEQIYKKSIAENLKWFDIFVKLKSFSDARTCMRLWRLHSEEIGIFDEEKYQEMKERLKK
jgi:hypothetical protein